MNLVDSIKGCLVQPFFMFGVYANIWWITSGVVFFLGMHPEYYPLSNFYDHKRILFLIWVAFSSIAWLFSDIRNFASIFIVSLGKRVALSLLLLVFTGAISSIMASHPVLAFRDYFVYCTIFSQALIVAALTVRDWRSGKVFVYSIMFFGGAYLFKFVVGLGAALYAGGEVKAAILVTGVMNINFAAQFLSFVVVLYSVYFLLMPQNIVTRLLVGLILVSAWALVFIAHYRGVALSTFSIVALIILLARREKLLKSMRYLGVLLASCGVYFIILEFGGLVEHKAQVSNLLSSNFRLTMWWECFLFALQHPFVGIGPGEYALQSFHLQFAHPHNIYMQFLAEWGVIAVFALAVPVIAAIVASRKWLKFHDVNSHDDILVCGALFSVFSSALLAGVSGVLVMPYSQMMFALFVGISIGGLYRFSYNPTQNSRNSWIVSAFGVFFVAGLLLTVWLTLDDSNSRCWVNAAPRFWSIGGAVNCEAIDAVLGSSGINQSHGNF